MITEFLGWSETPRRLLPIRYTSKLGAFLNTVARLGLVFNFNTLSCSETHIHPHQLFYSRGYQSEVEENLQNKQVKKFITSVSIQQAAAMCITSPAFVISVGI